MRQALRRIEQVTMNGRQVVEDVLSVEEEICIQVAGREFFLMASPEDLEALTAGFLVSAGWIESREDLSGIDINGTTVTVHLNAAKDVPVREVRTSGCLGFQVQGTAAPENPVSCPEVSDAVILEVAARLNGLSEQFRQTGCVHASLAVLGDGTELFFEDIGRHNTFDKIVGAAVLQGRRLDGALLATTGRISSEMVQKALRGRFGCIISRSAPTDRAVCMANRWGLQLIGFARSGRFNRYTLNG